MDVNELLALRESYRNGTVNLCDLSDQQINALCNLYDAEIKSLKAEITGSHIKMKHKYAEMLQSGTVDKYKLEKYRRFNFSIKKKTLSDYSFLRHENGEGVDLVHNNSYLSTYLSYEDLMWDLSFFYAVIDFEDIIEQFVSTGIDIHQPHKYRGTCTIMDTTVDKFSDYVHYADSLRELLAHIEKHEKLALEKPVSLERCLLRIDIYLYDEIEKKYIVWLGGREIRSVSDVLRLARTEKKLIPSEATQELAALEHVDVFISHKSQDFSIALKLYNHLLSCGIPTFLSEMSLPALSDSDYSFEIDAALEKAKNVIVIASSRENVLSGWVKYEWTTFANEKRSGRKNGSIVTLLSNNMDVSELPILLRQFEVLSWDNYRCATNFLLLDN